MESCGILPSHPTNLWSDIRSTNLWNFCAIRSQDSIPRFWELDHSSGGKKSGSHLCHRELETCLCRAWAKYQEEWRPLSDWIRGEYKSLRICNGYPSSERASNWWSIIQWEIWFRRRWAWINWSKNHCLWRRDQKASPSKEHLTIRIPGFDWWEQTLDILGLCRRWIMHIWSCLDN